MSHPAEDGVDGVLNDAAPEPRTALSPGPSKHETDPDSEFEATELRPVVTSLPQVSRILTPGAPPADTWTYRIRRFWRHHIRIAVPHVDCRDHLANERTFLAYLRTSLAFSMLGVLIAQLYRLQHAPQPNAVFGYYTLSRPVSGVFQSMALIVALLGAVRYFRQQHAMAIGKVHAGGWEVFVICALVLLILVSTLVLHAAVIVYKEIGYT